MTICKFSRHLGSGLFCLLILAYGNGAPADESARRTNDNQSSPQASMEPSSDLPNFHEVHPYLYRGGEPTHAGLEKLKELGVKTIIDLRGDSARVQKEREEATVLGMTSINLPMTSRAPTESQVKTFLEAVERAADGKGPVFVHCAHGSDRTGCLVGIFRTSHDGWSYERAYREMRKYYFSPKFTELSGAVGKYARMTERTSSQQASAPP